MKTAKTKTQVVIGSPKISERKLSTRVLGECEPSEFTIAIDPRQDSREYLDTLIHELTHCMFPDVSEGFVRKIANTYTKAIWDKGYRRIKV